MWTRHLCRAGCRCGGIFVALERCSFARSSGLSRLAMILIEVSIWSISMECGFWSVYARGDENDCSAQGRGRRHVDGVDEQTALCN